jgi:glutathionyl-hydroquinone reductase
MAARTALDELGAKGEFVRKEAAWRKWVKNGTYYNMRESSRRIAGCVSLTNTKFNHPIPPWHSRSTCHRTGTTTDPNAEFPAAAGRYHLYVAYACPWAHRTLLVRALKGLDEAISVTIVHPIWQKTKPLVDDHAGWIFGSSSDDDDDGRSTLTNKDGHGGPFPTRYPGNTPDPFGTAAGSSSKSIRDVYERVGDTEGKYTVPILYDTLRQTIVSNESSEIIRMLNAEFNEYAKYPELDLYPAHLRTRIDAVNDWVYPTMNNGVYRCGFATSQEAYDRAIAELTASFDRIDGILQQQRFIAGDTFTEADVRLFVTLVRFDEVYVVYFKTNTRSVQHTDSILNYCREIYQMAGVKDTVNMEQIKTHYYCSHPILNHYSIIPRGVDFCHLLDQPHNRDGGGAAPL